METTQKELAILEGNLAMKEKSEEVIQLRNLVNKYKAMLDDSLKLNKELEDELNRKLDKDTLEKSIKKLTEENEILKKSEETLKIQLKDASLAIERLNEQLKKSKEMGQDQIITEHAKGRPQAEGSDLEFSKAIHELKEKIEEVGTFKKQVELLIHRYEVIEKENRDYIDENSNIRKCLRVKTGEYERLKDANNDLKEDLKRLQESLEQIGRASCRERVSSHV